ncbi:MAG: hypothetical protein CM1200mP39_30770 [Dehalococcoidia bacterium]|nr:MAG: hypothetical protein CM1200mP39_30770 [Dehalococcoidia bacterium]
MTVTAGPHKAGSTTNDVKAAAPRASTAVPLVEWPRPASAETGWPVAQTPCSNDN